MQKTTLLVGGGGFFLFLLYKATIKKDYIHIHIIIGTTIPQVNLRKTKLLLFGTYHSQNPVLGLGDDDYFEQVGLALDVYNGYEKFLLAGDFNIEEENTPLAEFLYERGARNLVKEATCFKNPENPSCIDLFLTNSNRSFQGTTTVTTGLSDFHKMAVTVMKTTFPKAEPKVIQYRDYKNFNLQNFRQELRHTISLGGLINTYEMFEDIFMRILNNHAPQKSKVLRANDKPFMTKALRKAIMRRSALKNKFYKTGSPD